MMMMTLTTQFTRLVVVIFASSITLFAHGNESTKSDERNINLNALIHQHLLLCGYDYICDVSDFPLLKSPAPEGSYNITGVCPNCYCDDECMSRGDCCPDVYFAVPPMACVNTTLLNTTGSSKNLKPKPPSYEIVNSCPSETGSRERNLCEKSYTPQELLTRPPVASPTFPVSYKNRHCAMCNGENDTLNWILDIDCLKFADFNFLSTYQDIIDLARNRKCRMRYSPMDSPVRSCNLTIQPEEQFLIRSCNVSGSWKSFDLSIKLACESTYYLKFHEYKNVFCYICNQPTHMTSDVIDKCNVTGMWYPNDAGLERACLYHLTSQNTLPFKNIFCYLCNRIANDNETFYDVVTNITEDMVEKRIHTEYMYRIQTGLLRPGYLAYTYTTIHQSTAQNTNIINPPNLQASSDKGIIVRKRHTELNVTNLVYKQFAVRPFDQFCDKMIVPLQYVLVFFTSCSCYPSCLFRWGEICCLDFAFIYPASCLNVYVEQPNNEIEDDRGILVTDGCWKNRGHPIIRSRCESHHQPDIISFLPLIEKFGNTYYKSFDCFLCNENVDDIFPTETIETIATAGDYFLSDIDILCNKSLDFGHLVSFMDLINLSRYIHCSVLFNMNRGDEPFKHTAPYVKCIDRSKFTGTCNVTGNWPEYDPDVAWACENATGNILPVYNNFKNFYCYLCNPENVVTDVISTCNETGQWLKYNINHDKACHLFPRIYSYQIYKNIFCELCNSASFPNISANILDDAGDQGAGGATIEPPPFDNTFRSIFSVTEYDDILPEVDGGRCRKHQLYDYRKVGYCERLLIARRVELLRCLL
ncbi:hypothetical protein KP79_PYT16232 [Mizuhopecten yessoensis]|uniref:SMB domain-containing protein n=1 Tax=Mizuhopecten yessoensis TaxID=6573 RepID=A0A210R6H1_MIZYE|nr:hypothetical protein KP79_PYT16232 [Mizuhopecten yessoensis]